ncbi:MAG: SMP-30/gluconolactonase/LRE family protein [Candidatus Longimicrobiales bacterium M2_2A_002]
MTKLHRLALILVLPALAAAACGEPGADQHEPVADTMITVADVGFDAPESVLHDTDADVYLVSNVNGAPTDKDGNGFISRLAPNGELAALKWIDGQREGVTLDAPKGTAIIGDTLYVADITAVRAFHRVTGEPLGSREVPGSTFLNDLTVGPDGMLYVSDSGVNADFSSSGTGAVYRFEDGEPVAVAEGAELAGPNGLAMRNDVLVIVSMSTPEVRTVPAAGGEPAVLTELPGAQLDGVVVLNDGSMLVSSWETSTIYHVPPAAEGEATVVAEGIPSPADIGFDAERRRILIPVMTENRVEIRPLGDRAAPPGATRRP